MTIDKKELLAALEKCMPGIGTGTSIVEGADTFVFTDGVVYSYNSAISVQAKLPEKCKELKGVIKAVDCYKLFTKLPNDSVDVSVESDSWKLSCGRIKATLKCVDLPNVYERFKDVVPNDSAWLDVDCEELKRAVDCCNISGNTSAFNGVLFDGDTVYGTNGWELNQSKIKGVSMPKVWITSDACDNLLKWSFKKVQLSKTWLLFDADDSMFCLKILFVDKYPESAISSVISGALNEVAVFHAKIIPSLVFAIERASTLSEVVDDHNAVTLAINADSASVSSKRSSGDYNETIPELKSSIDVSVKLDIESFLSSTKKFSTFAVLSEDTSSQRKPVRLLFKTDDSVRLISSVV